MNKSLDRPGVGATTMEQFHLGNNETAKIYARDLLSRKYREFWSKRREHLKPIKTTYTFVEDVSPRILKYALNKQLIRRSHNKVPRQS